MREYGQFDVPNNTQVKCEFPCPKCGTLVKETYKITSEPHTDETATCPGCDSNYDVTITHDAGTGTVSVPEINNQKVVRAEGIVF